MKFSIVCQKAPTELLRILLEALKNDTYSLIQPDIVFVIGKVEDERFRKGTWATIIRDYEDVDSFMDSAEKLIQKEMTVVVPPRFGYIENEGQLLLLIEEMRLLVDKHAGL